MNGIESVPVSSPQICPVLIGRGEEIAELSRLYGLSTHRRFAFAVISGEAGAGKTRLQEEISRIAIEAGFQKLAGSCTERDRDFPFSPFIDMLRQRLREQRANPKSVLGQQTAVLAELLPELGHQRLDTHATSALSPEQSKRRLFESFVALLDDMASQQPLMLVLEDLHWADATSLELLDLLARRLATAPIFMLATARSEERSEEFIRCLDTLRRHRLISEIRLAPLTIEQTREMLTIMMPVPPSRAVAALIQHKTSGNPFFIEELVTSIGSGGDLSVITNELEIPDTVRETVWIRLRGLDSTSQQVADVGAVIGQELSAEILGPACGLAEDELARAVDELEGRHILVRRRVGKQSLLAFRHALTRDVIHDRIPPAKRRLLHRQIGDVLEEVWRASTGIPVTPADLGYHFHECGAWDKALEFASMAAALAWQVHATAEALIHYRRALDAAIALDDPSVTMLRLRCGQALALLGAFDEARQQLEAALVDARHDADRAAEAEALYSLSGLYASRDYTRALELADEAVAIARAMQDHRREALTLNRLGNVLTNTLRFSESRQMHEHAHGIFNRLEDQWGSADSLDLIAMNRYLAGDVPEARSMFQRAAEIFERLDDPERLASSITSRGLYLAVIDGLCGTDAEPGTFRADAERGYRICRDIGWRPGEAYALVALACADVGLGNYGSARALAESALAIAVDIEHQQWRVISLLTLGLLRTQLLDDAGALEVFLEALEIARAIGSTQWEERLTAWSARCHLMLGDINTARALVSPLVTLSTRPETIGRRRALSTVVEIELACGNSMESERRLNQLWDPTDPNPSPDLLLLRGDVLAASGDSCAADESFGEAFQRASKFGPRGVLWRASLRRLNLWKGTDQRVAAQQASLLQAELESLASSVSDEGERTRFLEDARERVSRRGPVRHRTTRTAEPGGLTPRERDVVDLVAIGLSNKEIAYRLSIAEKTVEMHVSNCLSKLEVSSRTQLAGWALSQHAKRDPADTG